ncbi:unnamed protein product [Adineta ricciae]|uniref:PLAT domain-containing protein n=1 Tax=Adineta ricciae TaxID=249248 RepID=A0A814FZ53_ADIRI|nr:unnamed protein product [Adineta ricciae]
MSHLLDSRVLANYNALTDEHLQSYFSHERIQTHLRQAGLIGRRGDIISEKEYRTKLARYERKKHVRQVLAENIVHRAIDMERARQAEIKRKLDKIEKAALVHSVKESRRRPARGSGYSSVNASRSDEISAHSMHDSWLQTRSKSTRQRRDVQLMDEEFDGQPRVLRVQSANVSDDLSRKHPSKSSSFQQRPIHRPKSSAVHRSSSLHSRSATKPTDSSCQIKMIYYGLHTKVDYDHSVFDSTDEIMVMQQHCGGENLIVYKGNHRPGDEFSFYSRRHSDFPLGLSLYVKGFIDSRISTCCEYKHRHGVRLGGERGHFAILSVQGTKPCLKCRFQQQMQSKNCDDVEDEEEKTITISMPVSDRAGTKKKSVQIPVKHGANSEHQSDDADEMENVNESKDGHASDLSGQRKKDKDSSSKAISSSGQTKTDKSPKTWYITFHSSHVPTGSFQLPKNSLTDISLHISLLSTDGQSETDPYELDMREYPQCFKSGREDTFQIELRDIGKPKQIRLLLQTEDEEKDIIKWHLDHIELTDVDRRVHYKFSYKQWIRPLQEKLLDLSETFEETSSRKSSTKKTIIPVKPKANVTKRASSSPEEFAKNRTESLSSDDEHDSVRYRVMIYPSKETDGEFDAVEDTQMYIRLNNQTKDSFIYQKGTKMCPSFESGESQTFDMDLIHNLHEQPRKLTIGYYNSGITARKWKIHKIVLINIQTKEETTFVCKEPLLRNDHNLRAERTFLARSKDTDDDDEQKNSPHRTRVTKHSTSQSNSGEHTPSKGSPLSSPKRVVTTPKKDDKKILPIHSHHSTDDDEKEENIDYNQMFNDNEDSMKPKVTSPLSRPKTRRGRQDTFETGDKSKETSTTTQPNIDIWRPASQLGRKNSGDHSSDSDESQNENIFRHKSFNDTNDKTDI